MLTSNATRELSEALKRRCLYLHLDYPDCRAREGDRARPGARRSPRRSPSSWCARCARCARSTCARRPSIAETIDWAQTLLALGLDTLDEEAVKDTLGVVLKHASDHAKAVAKLELN